MENDKVNEELEESDECISVGETEIRLTRDEWKKRRHRRYEYRKFYEKVMGKSLNQSNLKKNSEFLKLLGYSVGAGLPDYYIITEDHQVSFLKVKAPSANFSKSEESWHKKHPSANICYEFVTLSVFIEGYGLIKK